MSDLVTKCGGVSPSLKECSLQASGDNVSSKCPYGNKCLVLY